MDKEGDTYRTKCRKGRVTYMPYMPFDRERKVDQPWLVVFYGTVICHAVSALAGLEKLKGKGCQIDEGALGNG